MIITGYQGIGKSTLANKRQDVIDLESTCFWNYEEEYGERTGNKTRPDDWYVYYGQVAIDLSKQGYTVFVACHPQVREWLEKHHGYEPFCALFPSPSLEKEWIDKLQKRYDKSGLDKDLAALNRARDFYKKDINRLLYECSYGVEWYSDAMVIESIDYNLNDYVEKMNDYCNQKYQKDENYEDYKER